MAALRNVAKQLKIVLLILNSLVPICTEANIIILVQTNIGAKRKLCKTVITCVYLTTGWQVWREKFSHILKAQVSDTTKA